MSLLKNGGSYIQSLPGSVIPRLALQTIRAITTKSPDYTRTNWSYQRIPRQIPNMNIPGFLKDGKVRRGQGRSGRNITGKITVRHRGGGHQQTYRIIDFIRAPLVPEKNQPLVIKEKVLEIGYDPCRSARIAMLAGNSQNRQKLIVAPHELKVGDILTSSRKSPESLANLKVGDAYPLGTLPIGTVVHNIELKPGKGAQMARAAGTYAQIMRKNLDEVIVRLPSKVEKSVVPECLGTIGRASNIEHKNRVIGKAGRNRWLNKRPKGQTGKDRWLWKKKRV